MPCFGAVQPRRGLTIHIAADDRAILRISAGGGAREFAGDNRWERRDDHPLIGRAARQLTEYFEGRRREFDLPLDLRGTEFQKRVWEALLAIPYGETRSYGRIAKAVGVPRGARAVGGANHANPVAIVVPCHRVINAGGGLGGYGGGLPLKRLLLELERAGGRG
ncbi:MAG: methylated-DNA--[protein]-cysteine S-methyltransferase [Acidobacteriota bacterium]